MSKPLRIMIMTVGIFLLALFCAISMFLNTATDGNKYYKLQTELGVDAGVDGETMQELDTLLARYLKGNENALNETELFNADEKAHMVDVYNIFAALRTIKNAAFAVAAVLLVTAYYKRKNYNYAQLRLGIVAGVALFFLPFAAIGIWAAVDFNSAFIRMHELLFSNDLWLMDPRTDLMIRMLPERFFMKLGLEAALKAAAGALLVPMIIFIGTIDWEKAAQKNK